MNTVLLIDTRSESLGRRRGLLEEAGYRVVTAEDATSALVAFERYDPQTIIVDSKLPGRPSVALCRELRGIERQKDKRVALVMLTRGGGKKNRRTASEAARICDSVLREPVDDGLLLSTLGRFVSPVRVSPLGVDLPAEKTEPPRMPVGPTALEREIDAQLDAMIWEDSNETPTCDESPSVAEPSPEIDSPEMTFAPGGEEATLLDEVVDELLQEDHVHEAVRDTPRTGMHGDLETLELGEIVQMLALGGKTARVSLRCEADQGEVWFDGGQLVHASHDGRIGEKAFFEMVSWRSGDFTIDYGLRCDNRSLNQDAMYLVMEGMRLMDESRRSQAVAVVKSRDMELFQHERDRDRTPDDAMRSRSNGPRGQWVSTVPSLKLAGDKAKVTPAEKRVAATRPVERASFPWKGAVFVVFLLGAAVAAVSLFGL